MRERTGFIACVIFNAVMCSVIGVVIMNRVAKTLTRTVNAV